jgi:hypothetical protein
LNRKNALFAGSDKGGDNWTVIATLIENCKLSGINPHDWLTQPLSSLANGHPVNRLRDLMPWIAVPQKQRLPRFSFIFRIFPFPLRAARLSTRQPRRNVYVIKRKAVKHRCP